MASVNQQLTQVEIMDRIKRVLVEEYELPEENLAPDAALYEGLGLDSLDAVDLVVALEKAFGFKVVRATDEEKIRNIRLVRHIQDFVNYKLADAPTTPPA